MFRLSGSKLCGKEIEIGYVVVVVQEVFELDIVIPYYWNDNKQMSYKYQKLKRCNNLLVKQIHEAREWCTCSQCTCCIVVMLAWVFLVVSIYTIFTWIV